MITSRYFVSLVTVLALGCGGSNPEADPANTNANLLELDNGGLSTTDEVVALEDPAAGFDVAELQPTGADTMLDAAGALAADPQPAAMRRVFRVLILWGHLPRPNDAMPPAPAAGAPRPAPTDWTGSLSIENGALSVRRTLGFEDGDSVRPRAARERVEFVSRTLPFVDGLALTVRALGPAATLRMQTAAYTGDLPLPDADGAVRRLGDGHNAVYYVAYEERPGCNQGLVFGQWLRVRPHLGVLRGRVLTSEGTQAGSVRGLWGRNRAGNGVFFGKHLTNAGMFNGIFGGTYDDGAFQGRWATRASNRGELRGRYFDGAVRGDGHGLFLGRWREECAAR